MTKITVNSAEDNKSAKSKRAAHSGYSSSHTHNVLQKSTTLSRKYVRRPNSVKPAAKTIQAVKPVAIAPVKATVTKSTVNPVAKSVTTVVKPVKPTAKTISKPQAAKAAKERAVKSALRSVATMEEAPKKQKSLKKASRFFLALACSAATVAALAAFIHFSMPDISVKVAAMQNGVEANVPTYTPRGYQLRDVSSEKDGNIVMTFTGEGSNLFTLSETKSTWDSTALLNNYVKENYSSEYVTLREQGITVYVDGANAAWVNGGLLYEISATGQHLTKEQIRNLVVSL